MNETIVTLSNGKRVANFSSPHPFTFEDGTVLPASSNAEADRLKIDFVEEDCGNGDIKLTFGLTKAVKEEVARWYGEWLDGKVDIVFCPLPMIHALYNWEYDVKASPFRGIRMVDRISKQISITKQCL